MRAFWDKVGISASLVCIAHCLLTPFIVLLLPLAEQFLEPSWFHRTILLVVLPVAFWALINGYLRHRLKRILVIGFIGLSIMLTVTLMEPIPLIVETAAMVMAGLLLALAHFFNLRACQISS